MFAVILPARPATPLQSLSPTQFALAFPTTPHFSHIVVFLLPGTELPPGTAGAVYISINGGQFKFLGGLAMEKQSAIFAMRSDALDGARVGAIQEVDMDAEGPANSVDGGGGEITIGVSVEPVQNVATQLEALEAAKASASTAVILRRREPSTKVLAQRIIKNAFNFLASFTRGEVGNEVVPLKSFRDWWVKFERRIENEPGFLEKEDEI